MNSIWPNHGHDQPERKTTVMKKMFVWALASGFTLGAVFSPAQESSWVDKLEISGDLRGRFELMTVDDETTRSRMRGRARVGISAEVNEQMRAGVRIATGSDESPTSTNQSIEDFGNKRAIWLDLMYMAYEPEGIEALDIVLGKMKKPWMAVSDLMYDGDVNPEGVNAKYASRGPIDVTVNLGYFLWQDRVNRDPETDVTMGVGQLAVKSELTERIVLSIGANAFLYNNVEDAEIPVSESYTGSTTITDDAGVAQTVQVVSSRTLNKGNSQDDDGTWTYGYELMEGFARLDIQNDILPLKLYADSIVNMASGVKEDTAFLLGVGTHYKKLSFDYSFRDIDADALVGLLADGTSSGGGTGGSGHKFKLVYDLMDHCTAGVVYFLTENAKDQEVDTLYLDLVMTF